ANPDIELASRPIIEKFLPASSTLPSGGTVDKNGDGTVDPEEAGAACFNDTDGVCCDFDELKNSRHAQRADCGGRNISYYPPESDEFRDADTSYDGVIDNDEVKAFCEGEMGYC